MICSAVADVIKNDYLCRGWSSCPILLGVKVFGVGAILDTFFTKVLRMFYEIAEE